ncbi:hypothetical protein [Roseospira visakhapatnamensis]|uniref:Uncharacterized protein n=1 Tax=Roseospira visakhapatnamensis TaxID=390880 RepID=A0A7W6RGE4_9PROT|nr:hypothetical protein [Roseospira visakhapatnamensis]MBB4267855.1 hypothetical protein [Roseospira visakhapatnamensis]
MPYIEPDVPRPGLVPSEAQIERLNDGDYAFEEGSTNLRTRYVSVDSARAYAQFVQDAYQSALQRRSQVRSAVNVASLGGALAALGLGVVGADQSPTLITGLATTFLGISGQALMTKAHEDAYSLGAQAIGCVLTAATNARGAEQPLIPVQIALSNFQASVAAYRSAVDEAIRVAANTNKDGDEDYIGTSDPAHIRLKTSAEDRLARADLGLEYANRILQNTSILGEQLVNKVEEIRWAVNDAVRRSEPDVLVLDRSLRTIVSGRLAGLGVNVPAGAGDVVPDVASALTTQTSQQLPPELGRAWDEADRRGKDMDRARVQLTNALNDLPKQPIAFGGTVFSGCPLGGIENISGPGPITVTPASTDIKAGTAERVTAVLGGAAPFSVFDNGLATKPTISGDRLTVTVAADEATANRVITTPVGNLFGQTALFTITVKPATRSSSESEGGSGLLQSEDVRDMQGVVDANADGIMGDVTRRAAIEYLVNESLGKVTTQLNDSSVESNECKSAITTFRNALNLPSGTLDEDDVKRALQNLYSEDQYKSRTRISQDGILVNYTSHCGITP